MDCLKIPRRLRPRLKFAVVMLGLVTILWGCDPNPSIKIGFIGSLTGRQSDLGIAGRNGVMFAVEEVNRQGGINGCPVELVTRDGRQDADGAKRVINELIDEKVAVIIGPMTSAMSMVSLPEINRRRMLMVSPTASTHKLSGLDDYFIRVMTPNKAESDHLATYAYQGLGLRQLAVALDLSNQDYSLGYYQNFKTAFERQGGDLTGAHQFTSGTPNHFTSMVSEMIDSSPDGVLIIAGALDTALICQHLRRQGFSGTIASSGWAMTMALVHHGGPAVEGVVFSHLLNKNSNDPRYILFQKQYRKRFGHAPDFAAIHSYEAAQMVFKALRNNDDSRQLKETVLNMDTISGLHGDFKLDRYGDPKRKRFLTILKSGQYISAE